MDGAADRRASRGAAGRSGRGRAAAGSSGGGAPQLRGRLGRPGERDRALLAAAPDLHLPLAGLDAALAEREPDRAAEQLGIGELLPRARLAIVVQGVEPGGLELLVELVGCLAGGLAGLAERDQVDIERGERLRPRDAGLVRELLDGGGEDARGPDAVRAHPDVLLGA